MATVRAEEVRIPRRARQALARHEDVVVLSHDRPTFVIVNSEDHPSTSRSSRRGRSLSEALRLLAGAARPDPHFAADMEKYLESVGPTPEDPWPH
jgi:hypothetical protein